MSAERAQKFYNRSPRYVLQFKDNAIVRFAAAPKGSKKFQTKIINISETGMAFLVPFLENPRQDEIIKVEFQVPNSEPIACFAKVVRIEEHYLYTNDSHRQTFKLVAVIFMDLPVAQRQYIREGLNEEFTRIRKQHKRQQQLFRAQWLARQTAEVFASLGRMTKKTVDNLRTTFQKKKPRAHRYIDED